jgi:Ni/Co efflux regulator RcnB
MHRLLISTALVLLTAPAFAQPPDPGPTRGKGGSGQYQQQQQKPQQQRDRAQRQQAAPQQQRQQAAPQQQRQQAAPQNRGNRDVTRGGDRRPGYSAPRRDYSGFRRSYNSPRRFRGPTYHRPPGWYDRRWTFGEYLPSLFWSSSYWLNDFNSYALPPPPYGTVWVRKGRDALLIDRDTGEIISVRYAVFY